MHQYAHGVHKIANWAHITNAHPLPGPGIITGLASVGLALGRGLLILAEMSSAGSLAKGTYTASAVQMAREKRDFVVGFIAMQRVETLYPAVDGTHAPANTVRLASCLEAGPNLTMPGSTGVGSR